MDEPLTTSWITFPKFAIRLHMIIEELNQHISKLDDGDLSYLYTKSKQLSDLCWQEIKRRRSG